MTCEVLQFLNAFMVAQTTVSVDAGSDPLVSILIPVYNRENILPETIQAAIDQTYHQLRYAYQKQSKPRRQVEQNL